MFKEMLYQLYRIKRRRIRTWIRNLLFRIEGGDIYTTTVRKIMRDYHGVDIGMYTQGFCFVPGAFDRHTTVGRYCSIAADVRVFNRNHPMEFKSTHAFFFNPGFGYCTKDFVDYIPLTIGNDVWIGEHAQIMSNVTEIGDGAVIGAGAIVNKNVPPYAVIVGNPSRAVRYRFSKEIIEQLLAEKWWEKDIKEILPSIDEYQCPYDTPAQNTGLSENSENAECKVKNNSIL